ncbi:SRPBCC family protein [Cognatishimia maritima]|uniref:Polyketide cyclase / dehydrase and lipid transport n=1 Tax=Cognatishimia maritima TaxID=870908 RepID=A0A1M5W184_9RHOB|nr:SRPBCC family protein [Cognatishimia maritima]SHH80943.1 Polyketide cyclase / dehydrase and lipid transport [Cognatishimia maritima]
MNRMATIGTLDLKTIESQHVRRITKAPLRMAGSFDFAVSQEVLFPRISEPEEMAKWFPLLKGGDLDHTTSKASGDWGEGSKRQCYTNGMGTLFETIHYIDAPNAYTYEVKNFMMPIKDHLALMALTPNGTGGTTMYWHQYFNLKGIAMRHMFPTMMLGMMNRGMATLAKELGGKGGRIKRV